MTEVLRVFDDVYKEKVKYCVICLRSEKERKLVRLTHLDNFVKSVNLPQSSFVEKFQQICYICDRQAAAAHRFRLAVNLSQSVHSLYNMMTYNRKRDEVAQHLQNCKQNCKITRHGMFRNLDSWEERLTFVRRNTQLLQTEVLSVSSLQAMISQAPDPYNPLPRDISGQFLPGASFPPPPSNTVMGESEDLYLVPDEAPASPEAPAQDRDDDESLADALAEPEIYTSTVVIIDEEEDPIQIKREDPLNTEMNLTVDEPNIDQRSIGTNTDKRTGINNQRSTGARSNEFSAMATNFGPGSTIGARSTIPSNYIQRTISSASSCPIGPVVSAVNGNSPALTINPMNSNIIPAIVPIEKLLENESSQNLAYIQGEMQIMQRDPNEPSSFLLHPIIQNSGIVSVPSLSAQIIDGQLVMAGGCVDAPKIVIQNGDRLNVLTDQNQVTEFLKKMNSDILVASQNNAVQNVNFVTQSVDETQSAVANLQRSVGITPSGVQNSASVNSLPNVGNTGANIQNQTKRKFNSESDPLLQTLLGNVCDSIEIPEDLNSMDRDNTSKKSKNDKEVGGIEAVRTSRETDWEDKIPMDVISFMDATDPNAPCLSPLPPPTPPPLGVISEVKSMRNPSNTQEPMRNVQESNRSVLKPNFNVQEPNRDVQEPNRNVQEPNRNFQEPNRNVQELRRNVKEPKRNLQQSKRIQEPKRKGRRRESQGIDSGEVIDLC